MAKLNNMAVYVSGVSYVLGVLKAPLLLWSSFLFRATVYGTPELDLYSVWWK